jgi:hypothetical protein
VGDVLGFMSLFLCVFGPFFGIPAVILGVIAHRQIGRDPQRLAGKGYAVRAIYTGLIGGIVIPALVFLLLPSLSKSHVLSNRAVCAANLTRIMKAAIAYSADYGGGLPVAGHPAMAGTYSVATGLNSGETDGKAAMGAAHRLAAGNILGGPWLLVNYGQVGPKSFICKSDPNVSGAASAVQDARGQWLLTPEKGDQVSYSFAYPWDGAGHVAAWWRDSVDASLPLMADMTPREGTGSPARALTADTRLIGQLNSNNHEGEGQNVVFGDAHTEWTRKPNVGPGGDNIYTAGGTPGSPWGKDQSAGSITAAGTSAAGAVEPCDIFMTPVRDLNTGDLH